MTYLQPNGFRGAVSLLALACMIAGAWVLWGFGAALFAGGLFLAIDTSSDEAVERITKTTRYRTDGDIGGARDAS